MYFSPLISNYSLYRACIWILSKCAHFTISRDALIESYTGTKETLICSFLASNWLWVQKHFQSLWARHAEAVVVVILYKLSRDSRFKMGIFFSITYKEREALQLCPFLESFYDWVGSQMGSAAHRQKVRESVKMLVVCDIHSDRDESIIDKYVNVDLVKRK